MNPYSVLVKPMLSEKSVIAREERNQYSFIVGMKATKEDVKKAVQKLFGVDVLAVNTSIVRGKYRRRGAVSALTAKKKKAIVSVKAGQKIALFEDQ